MKADFLLKRTGVSRAGRKALSIPLGPLHSLVFVLPCMLDVGSTTVDAIWIICEWIPVIPVGRGQYRAKTSNRECAILQMHEAVHPPVESSRWHGKPGSWRGFLHMLVWQWRFFFFFSH